MITPKTEQPRISIIGKLKSTHNWLQDLARGFQLLDATVQTHNLQSSSLIEQLEQVFTKQKQLENKTICKRIKKELQKFSPNLVIVLNKAGLSEQANNLWRETLPTGTPIIGWICDRLGELPKTQKPNLNGFYFFDSSSKEPLKTAYKGTDAKIAYLPLAASPERFRYKQPDLDKLKPKLVFVGNCTESRRKEINDYREIGGEIDVYGPNTSGLGNPKNNRKINDKEQAELYRSHYAVFNPLQASNTIHGLNLRAFEAPLCGAIVTYPSDAEDLVTCFDPDTEILSYSSLKDLKNKVELLSRDPQRMLKMREAGRNRVLNDHTFTSRAQKILTDWYYK